MNSVDGLERCLVTLPEVRFAALFGSTARGEAKAGSDLDLALSPFVDSPESRRVVEVALLAATRRAIDFVYVDAAPPLLKMEVARDGRLLHEREAGAWADFRARAIVTWADAAPVLRRMWSGGLRALRERLRDGQA